MYSKRKLGTVCGLGTVTGLCGANCYHSYSPFLKGIDTPTYSEEELDRMNEEENTLKEYNGKTYTAYEAQQRQRRLETAMRADRQKIELLTQGGANDDTITGAKVKYFQRQDEYVKFSKAMNLPQQWDRVTVNGKNALGSKTPKKARNALPVVAQQPVRTAIQTETLKSKSTDKFMSYNRNKTVAKFDKGGIMNFDTERTAVNDVRIIGALDLDKYKCVTEDIITKVVVITEKQIEHIKERHPNDFERFGVFFKDIIENPDYIIEANKPNTALILKEIETEHRKFKTVLRLVTSTDDPKYKNSIITFMKIDEKEWNRILRNKKILYKSE